MRKILAFFAATAVTLFCMPAMAEDPCTSALRFAEDSHRVVVKSKAEPKLLDKIVDWEQLTVDAVGPDAWAAASVPVRQELVDLVHTLLGRSFSRLGSQVSDWSAEWTCAASSGDKVVILGHITPKKSTSREEPVDVEWHLEPKADGYRARELVLEGLGLVGSYRKNFAKILKKQGMESLLSRLRAKAQSGSI